MDDPLDIDLEEHRVAPDREANENDHGAIFRDLFYSKCHASISLSAVSAPPAVAYSGNGYAPENMDQLLEIVNYSRTGFLTALWCLAKMSDNPPLDNNSLTEWFRSNASTIDWESEVPEESVYDGTMTTALLVMLYNTGGTPSDRTRTGLLMKLGHEGSVNEFYKDCGFERVEWAGTYMGKWLWSSVDDVSRFLKHMGPIAEAWIITHAAAGTGAISRYIKLCEAFGAQLLGPCLAFRKCGLVGIMPAFACAYLDNSYSASRLEGPLTAALLLRVSIARGGSKKSCQRRAEGLMRDYAVFLTGLKEEECMTGFVATVKNDRARKGHVEKVGTGASELETESSCDLLVGKIRALNPGSVCWREGATEETMLDGGTGMLSSSDFIASTLEDPRAVLWGNLEERSNIVAKFWSVDGDNKDRLRRILTSTGTLFPHMPDNVALTNRSLTDIVLGESER